MCGRGRERTASSAPGPLYLEVAPSGVLGPSALPGGSFQPPPGLPPPGLLSPPSHPAPLDVLAKLLHRAHDCDAFTKQIAEPGKEVRTSSLDASWPCDPTCLRGGPAAGSCLLLPWPAGAGAPRSEAERAWQAGPGAQPAWPGPEAQQRNALVAAHSAGKHDDKAAAARKGRVMPELPEPLGWTGAAAAAGAHAAFDATVKDPPVQHLPRDTPPCQEDHQQTQNLTVCLEKLSELDSSRLLVVRGLHKLVTDFEWKLRQHFSGFGAVSQVVIVQNRRRRSYCGNFGNIGFILMHSAESVEGALAAGCEHRVGGAAVAVSRYVPRQSRALAAE